MGSFNVNCALSNDYIASGDEVVVVLLTQRNKDNRMPCHSWDTYAPVPILFEGLYSGYMGLENAGIFQSKNLLTQEENNHIYQLIETFLTAKTKDRNDTPGSLSEVFSNHMTYTKPNTSVKMVQALIDLHEELEKKDDSEVATIKESVAMQMKTFFKFDNIEQAKKYIIDNADKSVQVPLSVMMFKKEVFVKLLNEYGSGYEDENHYASILQTKREALPSRENTKECVAVITGDQNYAGSNSPVFTWHDVLDYCKNETDLNPNKRAVLDMHTLHCLDMSVVDEFFNMLGKTWQPAMALSEEIANYGHDKAYAMQQELFKVKVATNKPKM